MYEKYVDSIPGTKEYTFYTFFAAYITQDIESIEEAISDFKQTAIEEKHKELIEAIDEFFALDYPEHQKANFIEELSCGWIEVENYKEQLKSICDFLLK